jgi:alkylation response protein AidB-like acyl-CoA dehydrogenase
MISERPKASEARPIGQAWGLAPSPGYDALAAPFRPIFARIRARAVARELDRTLPVEEIGWLRAAGFTALRVPQAQGGGGASLPDLYTLLIELSQADSNVTQALRGHFGFVEHILASPADARRATWPARLAEGVLVGPAWSEVGETAVISAFATRLIETPEGWRLDGSKFYTTGCLFSDWIHVGATDAAGESVGAVVRRDAPGVEVIDDWDGGGQRLTASGTTHFRGVPVEAGEVVAGREAFTYSEGFFQLVHLATLAGIGRAAAEDLATAVGGRTRSYSHAAAPRPAEDPQILQVVGQVRSAGYCAGAIVLQVARALQKSADGVGQEDEREITAESDLEIWQAQTVVSDLILNATTILYDALGASATLRSSGLDRYWRNARTLTSHNPRIYKDRIIGNFAVNGAPPPGQWRIGRPA